LFRFIMLMWHKRRLADTSVHGYLRAEAARALGLLNDRRVVDPLIDALTDQDGDLRKAVVETLSNLDDPRTSDALLRAMSDSRIDVRCTSADSLGRRKDPRAVEPLVQALADEHPEVRKSAAVALGAIGDSRAVEPLIMAIADTDRNCQRAIANALGEIKDIRAVGPLITMVTHPDGELRLAAAKALARLSEEPWRDWVKGDRNDLVRLGSSGQGPVVDSLIETLLENDDNRQLAAQGLGASRDPRAVEPLIGVLSDKSRAVRAHAARALGELRDSRAVEPLVELLLKNEESVRIEAAEALGKINVPRAVEPLIQVLQESSPRWRHCDGSTEFQTAAIRSLGAIKDRRAVAPLVALIDRRLKREGAGQASVVGGTAEYLKGGTTDLAGGIPDNPKRVLWAVIDALKELRAIEELSLIASGCPDGHLKVLAGQALADLEAISKPKSPVVLRGHRRKREIS
jgi:HEAT repeat protein